MIVDMKKYLLISVIVIAILFSVSIWFKNNDKVQYSLITNSVVSDSSGIITMGIVAGDSGYISANSQFVHFTDTVIMDCSLYEAKIQKLQWQKDSLYEKLFLANMRVNKVKKYIRIVEKNPTQRKFLLGWMKRAVQ